MISDHLCVAKITSTTDTKCKVDIIFNGATSVQTIEIEIDEAPHIEKYTKEYTIDGESVGVMIEHARQVGQAGYAQFTEKLKEMYPNIMLVESSQFNTMVEAQEQAASMLVQ